MKNADGYEREYHSFVHHHLYSYPEYYAARAQLARRKYFQGISADATVLEYGCGLGQNIVHFPKGIGYDISDFSLAFCKSKGIHTVRNLSDLDDCSCDAVFSAHVLEHVDDPVAAVGAMKKKLKIGGRLILVLPVERPRLPRDLNVTNVAQHQYAWTFDTINCLLMKRGFVIERNAYLYGDAYHILLPLSRIHFSLYHLATCLAAYVRGTKEMLIVGIKK